jgi:hypothetical protein
MCWRGIAAIYGLYRTGRVFYYYPCQDPDFNRADFISENGDNPAFENSFKIEIKSKDNEE